MTSAPKRRAKDGVLVRLWDALFARAYYPGPGGVGYGGDYPDIAPYPYSELSSYYRTNPWVYRGVRAIGDAVSAVPLRLYKETAKRDGSVEREEVYDHPALELLNHPNPVQTGSMLKRALVSSFALTGEAWLYTDDGSAGKGEKPGLPVAIRSFRSENIAIVPDRLTMLKAYRYSQGGQVTDILPHFIAGARTWNPTDDYRGLPPMKVAKDPVMLEWYMTQHNVRFFRKGAYVGLYAWTDKSLEPSTRKGIEESLRKNFTGVSSQGGIPVLDSNLKFENAIVNARDGEFISIDKLSREQILAILGVPPIAVGLLDYANYANAWQQMKMFYQLTVAPMCDVLTDALNNYWLPIFWPTDKGLYLQFDLDDVAFLGDDAMTRAQVDALDIRSGARKINEVREERDLPPVPWGDDPPPGFGLVGGDVAFALEADGDLRKSQLDWLAKADYEMRRARQRAVDARMTKDVPLLQSMMIGYWSAQLRRILDELEGVGRSGAPGAQRERVPIRKLSASDLAEIFDAESEALLLRKVYKPVLERIVRRAGTQALIDIDSGVQFNVTDPRVVQLIESKSLRMASDVTRYTREVIQDILVDAAMDNATVEQVAARISSTFEDFERYRSLRVARTEIGGAHNGAAMEAYRQDGRVTKKGWAAVIDEATRDSHGELDGTEIPLDEVFANGCIAPGLGGDVGEIVNCRCALYPVVEEAGSE